MKFLDRLCVLGLLLVVEPAKYYRPADDRQVGGQQHHTEAGVLRAPGLVPDKLGTIVALPYDATTDGANLGL